MSDALEISYVLSKLIRMGHLSEAELARKIKVPRATINRLVLGRTPDPRASTLSAIAEYFKISLDQLLGKQPLLDGREAVITNKSVSIPIIELEEAIKWKDIVNPLNPFKVDNGIMVDPSICQGTFAVRVIGESMWPQFNTNSILVVSTEKKVKNRDYVIAYINRTKEVVFRQIIIDGSYKFLKAINDIFPTISFNEEDIIIGVITQTRINHD